MMISSSQHGVDSFCANYVYKIPVDGSQDFEQPDYDGTCPLAAGRGKDDDDDDDDDDDVKEHIEDTWQSGNVRGPALQRSHEGRELLVYNICIYVNTIDQN